MICARIIIIKDFTGNSELFSLDVNRKEQGTAGFRDIDIRIWWKQEIQSFSAYASGGNTGNGRFQ